MNEARGSWPQLSRLSREVAAADPELAAHMAQEIRAELPFYASEELIPFPGLVESATAHIDSVVRATEPGVDRAAPARTLGEHRARDGVALADVTDSLRVGTRYLWDRIVAYARAQGAATDAELVELGSEMWGMHDEYVQAMTAGYRREFAHVLLSRQQERLGLVYGLLTARGQEASSPWSAVDRLGLPRTGGFVVVAAATPTVGRMPLPRIEQELADRGTLSAWVMVGDVELGIVSAAADAWRDRLLDAARSWAPTGGVSPVDADFGNIGRAVRLARTALAAAESGELCFFGDAPLPVTAAGAPEVSAPVIAAVLGGLLAAAEPERSVLLETLDAWFAGDGTVATVAARLWVHQNTVRNRLRRVVALTGRDVAHPKQSAELFLALTAHRQTAGGAAPGRTRPERRGD